MVPASPLRAFVDALARLGFDVRKLLASVGLSPGDLEDPDATVPSTALDRVLCTAVGERRHPDLGARLAAVTPIGAFPLLDYLVVTTDTVGGALDQLVRYFHLVCSPVSLEVVRDARALRLVVQSAGEPLSEQYDTTLAVLHLRAETDQRLRVSYVSLTHEPDDRADLERLLGCPVHPRSAWAGVEFPSDVAQLPLRRRDPTLRRVLETHAAGISAPVPAEGKSVVAAARAVIASRIGAPPSLAAIGRQLAIAPRTLQRRLADEGVTYLQLVDLVRRETAERLLGDATLAISEIGYLLGFSEPSAFHRAFKRWHDVTPQEYRRRVRASKG
jgi:AraC-like DNA-binding protein